ncbi:hypothetical protein MESS4_20041 [Mesorhizobium sp. STM 4661]|nr:hypothetical protein MESS4_20041 [Mesorhizobium sp. STM 4661]
MILTKKSALGLIELYYLGLGQNLLRRIAPETATHNQLSRTNSTEAGSPSDRGGITAFCGVPSGYRPCWKAWRPSLLRSSLVLWRKTSRQAGVTSSSATA